MTKTEVDFLLCAQLTSGIVHVLEGNPKTAKCLFDVGLHNDDDDDRLPATEMSYFRPEVEKMQFCSKGPKTHKRFFFSYRFSPLVFCAVRIQNFFGFVQYCKIGRYQHMRANSH